MTGVIQCLADRADCICHDSNKKKKLEYLELGVVALMAFQTLHTEEVPRYKPHHMHQTTEGDTQKVHALPPLCT